MKTRLQTPLKLLALWLLGCGFAMHMIGNSMWLVAPWLALLLTLRFVRVTPARIGLPLAAAGWALAYYVGWHGVLPFNDWKVVVVPVAAGLIAFLPFVADRLWGGVMPRGLRWLVLPVSWVAMETGFRLAGAGTWGALAYSQYGFDALLQGVAVLGLAWPALVIASFASIGNAVWEAPKAAARPAVVYALCVIAALALGSVRMSVSKADQTVRVAGVVVDNSDAFKATWGPLSYGEVLDAEALKAVSPKAERLFDELLAKSDEAADQGAKLIVWSEGNALVPAIDEERMVARGQSLAARRGVWLFMSMAVMVEGQSKARNLIVVVDHQGNIIDRYLKSHPTPGEASVKGDGVMRWADTPYGRVAWAICYDFDYPELIAQAGRARAGILIDPSWDSRGMTPLHSQMATFRSIENGASLVRPVNDGLNIVSDATGRPIFTLRLDRGRSSVWSVDVPVVRQLALYPWIEPLMGLFAALSLAVLLFLGGTPLLKPERRS